MSDMTIEEIDAEIEAWEEERSRVEVELDSLYKARRALASTEDPAHE